MKMVGKLSLLLFILLVPLGASLAVGQFFEMENINIGKKAPDFTLNTLGGKKVNLTEYRHGQKAIIFFWATWCPHCREALKELNKMGDELGKKGIKTLLVDLSEGMPLVRSYVEKNKINFDVFLDEDGSLAESYGIIGVPTFFFVNQKGVVQAVEHYLPENFESILAQDSSSP